MKIRSRRTFLKQSTAAGLGLLLPVAKWIRPRFEFDLLIKNGLIYDGTGAPAWQGDVGIVGDTIRALGRIAPERARKVIDARGRCVCPGFIDIHSHSDSSILGYPTAESRIGQGITTEVTGNCGHSAAPLQGKDAALRIKQLQEEYGFDFTWNDVASYFAALEKRKIAVNQALLLGQGTLRSNIIGTQNRPATPEERRLLQRAVEEGMDQGAWGLSTGLEYTPGRYTQTDEIVAMARGVARRGGLYASHIRNEEAHLLEAINEAIDIGRQAGVRVQISHLKAAGKPNWHLQQAALHLIESARRDGVEVLADAYPYAAYSTGLTLFLEPWAQEGGTESTLHRLREAYQRRRILAEVHEHVQRDPGDYDLIVISSVKSEKNRQVVGKTIVEIAELWQIEPAEAILRLLEEESLQVSFVGHGMSEANVEKVLAHPLVMIGSDGYSMVPRGRALQTQPHPRSYGTCARVLGHYVRERNLFDLATAIKKMTSMPAAQLGLQDRGRLGRGMKADLVLFDPDRIADRATFTHPHRFPEGIETVIVNGRVALGKGLLTGSRAGLVLRK